MGKKIYCYYSQEERSAYLKDFEQSGMSLRAFCQDKELNHWTLNSWVRAQRIRNGASECKFVALKAKDVRLTGKREAEAQKDAGLITLQRGLWRIEISGPVQTEHLEQIIQTLEAVHGV